MHFHGLSFHLVLDCSNDKHTKVVIELKFQTKIADKRYNSHATGGHFTKLHISCSTDLNNHIILFGYK